MAETHTAEELQKHVRTYLFVFGALLILTVATVAVAYLNLSIWPALVVALIIAMTKGGLVAAYFMHLLGERKIILWVMLTTVALVLMMFAIFMSAYHDQDRLTDLGSLFYVA